MIPIELTEPSPSTMTMTEESCEFARKAELDLAKEDREKAKVKEESFKQ